MWDGYFDRRIGDPDLVRALCGLFPKLKDSEVFLMDHERKITAAPTRSLAVVRREVGARSTSRDFFFQVTLHPTGSMPLEVVPAQEALSDAQVMGGICSEVGARCLVGDPHDPHDPDGWLLVDGGDRQERVTAEPVTVYDRGGEPMGDRLVLSIEPDHGVSGF